MRRPTKGGRKPTRSSSQGVLDGSKQRPFAAKLAGAPKKKPASAEPPRDQSPEATAPREPKFAELMRGATPLAAPARGAPLQPVELIDEEGALAAFVNGAIRFEVVDDGASLEGRRIDVDPRELRRLRQRFYSVDGKLDLHGHTVPSARAAVERFLERRRSQGDRAILIVHGRGNHSPRGEAVLRGELGAWLSQGSSARHVLAFASIADSEGGSASGALFVLLAKR